MQKGLVIICVLLSLTGCQLNGEEKNEKRMLPAFSSISLSANASIHLSQGNDQKVELTGEEESINKLITEVKDGRLIIRYPKESNFNFWYHRDKKKMDIRITLLQIDKLEVTGAGSILADDLINTKNLDLRISGAANVRFRNINSEKISSQISGTGNIFLSGHQTVSELTTTISGTGIMRAMDLPADDVKVSISGTGNCWVTANKNLDVRISGMGVVHYHGSPNINKRISGLGHLEQAK